MHFRGGGGGGSNNKKGHATGKNQRCPLSFLFFFQNTFNQNRCFFVPNLVKNAFLTKFGTRNVDFDLNVSSKKNKIDHDFCLF